jgi:hypothetical protein
MAASQLPPDFTIAAWLEGVGLGEYVEVFEQNKITPELLSSLSDEDLRRVGIELLGHRKKILLAIRELRSSRRERTFGSRKLAPVSVPKTFAELSKPALPERLAAKPASRRLSSGSVPGPPLPVTTLDGVVTLPISEPVPSSKPSRWPWKRMGGSFLLISIAAHVLFGIGATYFIVQTIQAKRKLTFQAGPKSPNPSQRAIEHKVSMAKKQSTMSAPAQPKRITTTGASKVALPDMPSMPKMDDFTPGQMAGVGGTGIGTMLGGAGGPSGGSSGAGMTFFGLRSGGNGLKGTFYDLKQNKSLKPTGMTPQEYAKEITSFLKGGWNSNHFSRFYKAPAALYATQIFIPDIDANKGPTAFGVAKEVQPRMWVVHYTGMVSPPESGTYHFVGQGDDVLLVKFDNRMVLAACWNNRTFGIVETKWKPQGIYTYGWPPNCPSGGLVKGDPMEVHAGASYPIEVLIGEQPGGRGCAALLIEKEGEEYKKDPKGNPILPIFRVGVTKMPPLERGESLPPYQAEGPIWKVKPAAGVQF